MNRLIYRHLKNLRVDKKRQILLRLSKEIGYSVEEIKNLTNPQVLSVFEQILNFYCKEGEDNV